MNIKIVKCEKKDVFFFWTTKNDIRCPDFAGLSSSGLAVLGLRELPLALPSPSLAPDDDDDDGGGGGATVDGPATDDNDDGGVGVVDPVNSSAADDAARDVTGESGIPDAVVANTAAAAADGVADDDTAPAVGTGEDRPRGMLGNDRRDPCPCVFTARSSRES